MNDSCPQCGLLHGAPVAATATDRQPFRTTRECTCKALLIRWAPPHPMGEGWHIDQGATQRARFLARQAATSG